MTDGLSDVSSGMSSSSCQCFVNIGIWLFRFNTIASEDGLWNVVLTLLCCNWTSKCLLGCQMFETAWNCLRVSVLLLLCGLRLTVFTEEPNDGLHFRVSALNVTNVISPCKDICREPIWRTVYRIKLKLVEV